LLNLNDSTQHSHAVFQMCYKHEYRLVNAIIL